MVPTSKLPQIRTIPSQSTHNLAEALQYLRTLYQPHVRGSRRRRSSRLSLAKDTAVSRDARVHLDPFERNYTLRWLTALISYLETQDNSADVEPLIQLAASILTLCSGTSAAGTFHRDFIFASNSISSCSVTLRVRDIPLNNQDYASVGAQTWGGACVLSESIVDEPWKFGLCHAPQNDLLMQHNSTSYISPLGKTKRRSQPLRILELGAGTGLVSLTICKLLQDLVGLPSPASSETHSPLVSPPASLAPLDSFLRSTSKPIPISSAAVLLATDHYPPVLENLALNIATNFPSHAQQSNDPISFTSHHLDWSHFSSTYAIGTATPPKPFDEPFDVIFGADIIYELEHASWIKSCLSVLLRKPDRAKIGVDLNRDPAFHLVIPLRSTHVKESRTVELVFPFSEYFQGVQGVWGGDSTLEMCVLSKEVIICEAEDGEGDDNDGDGEDGVTYLYYKIGWSIPRRTSV